MAHNNASAFYNFVVPPVKANNNAAVVPPVKANNNACECYNAVVPPVNGSQQRERAR